MRIRRNVILTICLSFLPALVVGQTLLSVDQRSRKGKIDPSTTTPIVVLIDNDERAVFDSKIVSLPTLKDKLDQELDTRSIPNRLIEIRFENPHSTFARAVDVLKLGRDLYNDDFTIVLGSEDTKRSLIKLKIVLDAPMGREPIPGGLFSRIEITRDGKFSFNGRPQTPDSLSTLLITFVADRTKRKIKIEGSDEINKTVFIKPARSSKMSDVVQAIEIATKAGAGPMAVQIDWLKP